MSSLGLLLMGATRRVGIALVLSLFLWLAFFWAI